MSSNSDDHHEYLINLLSERLRQFQSAGEEAANLILSGTRGSQGQSSPGPVPSSAYSEPSTDRSTPEFTPAPSVAELVLGDLGDSRVFGSMSGQHIFHLSSVTSISAGVRFGAKNQSISSSPHFHLCDLPVIGSMEPTDIPRSRALTIPSSSVTRPRERTSVLLAEESFSLPFHPRTRCRAISTTSVVTNPYAESNPSSFGDTMVLRGAWERAHPGANYDAWLAGLLAPLGNVAYPFTNDQVFYAHSLANASPIFPVPYAQHVEFMYSHHPQPYHPPGPETQFLTENAGPLDYQLDYHQPEQLGFQYPPDLEPKYHQDSDPQELAAVLPLEPNANDRSVAGIKYDEYLEANLWNEDIKNFANATILVEATHYIEQFIYRESSITGEPLLTALGGSPLALKKYIEADLDNWKANQMTPIFVFEGQSIYGKEEMALRAAVRGVSLGNEAFGYYENNDAMHAVQTFGRSEYFGGKDFYRFLQQILSERKIEYVVAVHSACAQIAYLNRLDSGPGSNSEGILGSYELLLYNIDSCIIKKIDWDAKSAKGVVKGNLMVKLGANEDVFIDALLMTGTSFLPAFPGLKHNFPNQPCTVKEALNLYRTANKSMGTLCETWSEIVQQKEPDWQDKYRRAKMAIKHNIVLNQESTLFVNAYDELSEDHHLYLNLRLPDEMYHYLWKGAVGPRVYNWLSSLEVLVSPPLQGGETEEYRRLVSSQLVPIQEQTVSLYASRMHRAFQHKTITMRFWYDANLKVSMKHEGIQPAPKDLAGTWNVTRALYESREDATQASPGSITFALVALEDENFAKSTITPSPRPGTVNSTAEILANTIWRFLHLRGYVDDGHKLTVWGEALLATFRSLNPVHRQEEAALLAFELLRLDQLSPRDKHPDMGGSPFRGTDEQKMFCGFIGRCACLLKLRHEQHGYSGPLSRSLLAFGSIISAVRKCDRDLIEGIFASMFLFANAERQNRTDWAQLGLSLPLLTDVSIAMGIAVKTYLDEQHTPPTTDAEKAIVMAKYSKEPIAWATDFQGDLKIAFSFFDALYDGVKTLGDRVADQDLWTGARKYLAERR